MMISVMVLSLCSTGRKKAQPELGNTKGVLMLVASRCRLGEAAEVIFSE
ncbi:hypothetical protein [Pseudomonas citronellolis]|nr:hypothetical protein [Pseudomonas citronellolis]MDF3932122.1 hypothetical protein [Pseudomonas citronellolis]